MRRVTAASHASSNSQSIFPVLLTVQASEKNQTTFVGATSSPKHVLLQGAPLATLHISLFCHQSTEHWATKQISPFPTSSICPGAAPEASPAGSSPDLHLLFTERGFCAGISKVHLHKSSKTASPCFRNDAAAPLFGPAAPQVSFDHSLPHSLLRLSVSKDQTSLFCFKSIFCECKDLLHAKISFVWEWRCGRTALNNNSLEQSPCWPTADLPALSHTREESLCKSMLKYLLFQDPKKISNV